MSSRWWTISEAEKVLGLVGSDLIMWIQETISKPDADLGRQGALCPYVPAALRSQLLYGVIADPTQEIGEALCAQAETFHNNPSAVPGKSAELQSVLVMFPGREGADLHEAVASVKGRFIETGLTCGEFYPDSEDRSARTQMVRVARAPVPLVAIRFLTSHDELFLGSHPEYGPKFRKWMATSQEAGDQLKKSDSAAESPDAGIDQLTEGANVDV